MSIRPLLALSLVPIVVAAAPSGASAGLLSLDVGGSGQVETNAEVRARVRTDKPKRSQHRAGVTYDGHWHEPHTHHPYEDYDCHTVYTYDHDGVGWYRRADTVCHEDHHAHAEPHARMRFEYERRW